MPCSYLVAGMYVEQSEFAQAVLLMWPQGPGPAGQPVVPHLQFVSSMHVGKRDGYGSAGTTGCCATLTPVSIMCKGVLITLAHGIALCSAVLGTLPHGITPWGRRHQKGYLLVPWYHYGTTTVAQYKPSGLVPVPWAHWFRLN